MNGNAYRVKQQPTTILCATDFSDSSLHALRWSVEMAERLGAHIIVLYTFRLLKAKNSEAISAKKKIEEEAVSSFSLFEKEMLLNKGLSYEFISEVGFVTDRVEDHVKKQSIHLLVVSKSISKESKEVFEELVDQVKIPLVVVP